VGANQVSASSLSDSATLSGSGDTRRLYHVHGVLEGGAKLSSMLVDSGSEVSLLPKTICKKLGKALGESEIKGVQGFDGSRKPILGSVTVKLSIGEVDGQISFLVVDGLDKAILGNDALEAFRLRLDFAQRALLTEGGKKIFCHYIESSKNGFLPGPQPGIN